MYRRKIGDWNLLLRRRCNPVGFPKEALDMMAEMQRQLSFMEIKSDCAFSAKLGKLYPSPTPTLL